MTARNRLLFSAVNRRGQPGYLPGYQKHHVLPVTLERYRTLDKFIRQLPMHRFDLHDFRGNGMLLPGTVEESLRSGLPLHRGPHRRYTQVALDRLAMIEHRWSRQHKHLPRSATGFAARKVNALTAKLRRCLLAAAQHGPLLNSNCPIGRGRNFMQLDAMADELWGATAEREEA